MLSPPQLPHDGSSSRPDQLPTDLDGNPSNYPSSKGQKAVPTFSRVVKLGMGSVSGGSVSRTRTECNVYSALGHLESTYPVTPTEPITPEFDLPTMILFGKIWGEPIPFHLIRIKTKRDWNQVRGHVDYVDMGNGWILFKFSTVRDWDFVWLNGPWFVSGLNLVLKNWVPMFDPYSAHITHVDQWTTITRLPQEFWEETKPASLLAGVGGFSQS